MGTPPPPEYSLPGPTSAWTRETVSNEACAPIFLRANAAPPLDPGSGVRMKIWTCFGLNTPSAQTWTYTADNRIALTGKGADDAIA